MQNSLVVKTFFIIIAGSAPFFASAHVLKSDGSIGAIIHINPEDNPIVGEPATFFFEFKDKENKFQPSGCDCRATIVKSGEELFSENLFANTGTANLNTPVFSFTFPEKGIYQVRITGNPINGGNFQPFTLTYDFRIERTGASSAEGFSSTHSGHSIILGVGLALMLGFYFQSRKPRKSRRSLLGIFVLISLFSVISHHTAFAVELCSEHTGFAVHPCCIQRAATVPERVSIQSNSETKTPLFPACFVRSTSSACEEINNKSPPCA